MMHTLIQYNVKLYIQFSFPKYLILCYKYIVLSIMYVKMDDPHIATIENSVTRHQFTAFSLILKRALAGNTKGLTVDSVINFTGRWLIIISLLELIELKKMYSAWLRQIVSSRKRKNSYEICPNDGHKRI